MESESGVQSPEWVTLTTPTLRLSPRSAGTAAPAPSLSRRRRRRRLFIGRGAAAVPFSTASNPVSDYGGRSPSIAVSDSNPRPLQRARNRSVPAPGRPSTAQADSSGFSFFSGLGFCLDCLGIERQEDIFQVHDPRVAGKPVGVDSSAAFESIPPGLPIASSAWCPWRQLKKVELNA